MGLMIKKKNKMLKKIKWKFFHCWFLLFDAEAMLSNIDFSKKNLMTLFPQQLNC